MKKILVLIVVIAVFMFALWVAKDQIMKGVVSAPIARITGADIRIGGFSLGLLSQSVRITDIKIYNPKGFTPGIMLDAPEISASCDMFALLKGKLRMPLVNVDLKEMVLEKNKEDLLNVDSLKVTKDKGAAQPKGADRNKQTSMRIDLLTLRVSRIVYKDYSAGAEPAIRVYDINLKKSYRNITSAQQLTVLILTEPMKQAGIKGAEIYGISVLAGVAILPVAVAVTLAGKDSVEHDFDRNIDELYRVSLATLKKMGKVDKESRAALVIEGEVKKARVTVRFKEKSAQKTGITVSARKHLFPSREIASGILYSIQEELR